MITISDSILSLTPTPVDRFACNYYIDGANVKILTIAEYLEMIPLVLRRLGFKVIFIEPAGTVSLSSFILFQQTCTVKYYMFVGGVEDDKFIETTS